ncbi:MAG: ExeA family protein [Thermoguttaceae bacterium]
MIESYFGLARRPFLAIPDVGSYFHAACMESARTTIGRCLDRGEGVSLIIGSSGIGKTLLLRILEEPFQMEYAVARFSNTRLKTPKSFLQQLLFALHQPFSGSDETELRLLLLEYLRRSSLKGIVLLIDEAQSLTLPVFEEIRLLLNYDDGQFPQFRVALAGTPTLEERLTHPKLTSFNQWIVSRSYLEPFSGEETSQYILWQLHHAKKGSTMINEREHEVLFDESARKCVHQLTEGIPRLVNQLCDHALLYTYEKGQTSINSSIVRSAWSQLQQIPEPATSTTRTVSSIESGSPTESVGLVQPVKSVESDRMEDQSGCVEFGLLEDDFADEIPNSEDRAKGASPMIPEFSNESQGDESASLLHKAGQKEEEVPEYSSGIEKTPLDVVEYTFDVAKDPIDVAEHSFDVDEDWSGIVVEHSSDLAQNQKDVAEHSSDVAEDWSGTIVEHSSNLAQDQKDVVEHSSDVDEDWSGIVVEHSSDIAQNQKDVVEETRQDTECCEEECNDERCNGEVCQADRLESEHVYQSRTFFESAYPTGVVHAAFDNWSSPGHEMPYGFATPYRAVFPRSNEMVPPTVVVPLGMECCEPKTDDSRCSLNPAYFGFETLEELQQSENLRGNPKDDNEETREENREITNQEREDREIEDQKKERDENSKNDCNNEESGEQEKSTPCCEQRLQGTVERNQMVRENVNLFEFKKNELDAIRDSVEQVFSEMKEVGTGSEKSPVVRLHVEPQKGRKIGKPTIEEVFDEEIPVHRSQVKGFAAGSKRQKAIAEKSSAPGSAVNVQQSTGFKQSPQQSGFSGSIEKRAESPTTTDSGPTMRVASSESPFWSMKPDLPECWIDPEDDLQADIAENPETNLRSLQKVVLDKFGRRKHEAEHLILEEMREELCTSAVLSDRENLFSRPIATQDWDEVQDRRDVQERRHFQDQRNTQDQRNIQDQREIQIRNDVRDWDNRRDEFQLGFASETDDFDDMEESTMQLLQFHAGRFGIPDAEPTESEIAKRLRRGETTAVPVPTDFDIPLQPTQPNRPEVPLFVPLSLHLKPLGVYSEIFGDEEPKTAESTSLSLHPFESFVARKKTG